ALGVRLPAQIRCLLEPDRTLVEDLALIGTCRPTLRDVARHCRGSRGGDGLLERPSAPVPVGTAARPPADTSDIALHLHCQDAPHLANGPLSLERLNTIQLARCKMTSHPFSHLQAELVRKQNS